MYKAVVFDFDYTLGDSTPGIVTSANYALQKMGCPPADTEAIRKTIGLTLQNTYKALTGDTDPQRAQQYADGFHEKAYEIMVESTELYPGVLTALRALHAAGLQLAVVTTKAHRTIEGIVRQSGLEELLGAVIGGDDVQNEKPDPEGLLGVITRFGLAKADVLYVGDSLVDAQTARAAGVDFAAVLTGTTPAGAFEAYRPAFVGRELGEVYAFVAGCRPASTV